MPVEFLNVVCLLKKKKSKLQRKCFVTFGTYFVHWDMIETLYIPFGIIF